MIKAFTAFMVTLAMIMIMVSVAVLRSEPAGASCGGVVWRRSAFSMTQTEWIDVTNGCGRVYGFYIWKACTMWEGYDTRIRPYRCL